MTELQEKLEKLREEYRATKDPISREILKARAKALTSKGRDIPESLIYRVRKALL